MNNDELSGRSVERRAWDEAPRTKVDDMASRFGQGSATELSPWLQNAAINRDRNLKLQYLAGLALNRFESGSIYAELLRYVRYPEQLFKGEPSTLQVMRVEIERALKEANHGPAGS